MSLQFIIGPAGSGKSTYLYRHVVEEATAHPKQNYLVIVPEQFTMHTQQQLVAMHPEHAIMNIDVLSFNRMAYRVFDELGTDTLEVLEETGKNLLLRKVAQEQAEQLHALKKKIKRPGYIAQVKSLISEFTQYDISPEDLRQILQDPAVSEAFRYKAQDVLVMYEGFCDMTAGKYITTEQILQKLLDVVADSALVSGSTIVLDGFTGFTPIQNQLLQALLRLAHKVMVTVTCDTSESLLGQVQEQELFAMSKTMVAKLTKMARDAGVAIEQPVTMDNRAQGRFVPGGYLSYLEAHLFRQGEVPFTQQMQSALQGQETTDAIGIVGLMNPRQELQYVAGEIERQVRKGGVRYRDFAIVCANLDAYKHMVPQIFERYHIPYFLDAKTEVVFHPLIESMNSLLMMVEERFSYQSVMRLLRTGMTDLSVEETDALDNYILAANIRGYQKYRRIFEVQPYGYTPEDLVELNGIRQKFIAPLDKVMEVLGKKEATVIERSTALYEWMVGYQMQERLQQKAQQYRLAGDEVRAREYEQIYGVVMNLLDKLVAILGDEVMTVAEYAEILATGFESLSIGMIPPAQDCVMIGDMERTRLSDIRTMYLIGANDGAIPKALGNGGILSQWEREQLKELDVELAPSDRQKAFMQRFYLYFVMTKPSRQLFVTFTRVDNDGKALRRSYLIHTLQKLFPTVAVTEYETLPVEDRLLTQEVMADYFAECLREYVDRDAMPEAFSAMLDWQRQHPSQQMERLEEAAFYTHRTERLSRIATDAVFGHKISESVSRMEQYARCAYAYFLKYGLQLAPRQEHAFAVVDMGNLYHAALEHYSKSLLMREDVNWYTITPEQSDALLEESIVHTYQTMSKTQVLEDARDAYILHKMEQTLHQTIWALTEQVRKGSFIPSAFEVDFQEVGDLEALQFQLDEMHTMRLRGKIDRVDLHKTDDKVYVKIVDYKSGHKDLDFQQLYHGLQVQLVLYMDAVTEGLQRQYPNRQVEPGAMFYYRIDDPLVRAEEVKKGTTEDAVLKALQMKGVVNADAQVVEALHHGLQGYSNVIPVGVKSEGQLYQSSSAVSAEEFRIMEDYVQMLMRQTGQKIMEGQIDCVPFQMGQQSGCTYCDYHGVCGFDARMNGYEVRRLTEGGSRQEIIEQMTMDLAKYHGRSQTEAGGETQDAGVDQSTATGH